MTRIDTDGLTPTSLRFRTGQTREGLTRMCDASGGEFFPPADRADLADLFFDDSKNKCINLRDLRDLREEK
jgi:hypothetical protein